jgi:hypothetical protein
MFLRSDGVDIYTTRSAGMTVFTWRAWSTVVTIVTRARTFSPACTALTAFPTGPAWAAIATAAFVRIGDKVWVVGIGQKDVDIESISAVAAVAAGSTLPTAAAITTTSTIAVQTTTISRFAAVAAGTTTTAVAALPTILSVTATGGHHEHTG